MAAGKNRFPLELNEKEVIELIENATPGSTKKVTKYGMQILQGKNLKTYFNNLIIYHLTSNVCSWNNYC